MGEAAAKQSQSQVMVLLSETELRRIIGEAVRAELGNAKQSEPDTNMLTTKGACAYCKMSKRAFLHHIGQGRLVPDSPARPGFSTHRFYRSTLDAFLVAVT